MHRGVATVRFVARTYGTLRDLKHRRVAPAVAGRRIAGDVAAMGPLYVKMAQFLASRRDALDPEFADALAVVQDRVPPGGEAPTVEGFDVGELVGSASIADVYRARRRADGADVAIKRRRPGVSERVREDLPLLRGVMGAAAAAGLPGAANVAELVREAEPVLLGELDFRLEARAQTRFRRRMHATAPWLVVPRVLAASEDTMVSHYVPSRRLGEVLGPNPALATRLMDMYMRMLEEGVVHADPHPGNVGVLPDGRVVLYDFGAVLEVPESTRRLATGVLAAALSRDADGVVGALEGMGVLRVAGGRRVAVRRLVRAVLADPAAMHTTLADDPEFAQQGLVRFSREFLYLTRTLALVDAACRSLDPDFAYDFGRWAAPAPTAAARRLLEDTAAMPAAMHTMQRDMEDFQCRVLAELEEGKRGAARAVAACLASAAVGAAYFLW